MDPQIIIIQLKVPAVQIICFAIGARILMNGLGKMPLLTINLPGPIK